MQFVTDPPISTKISRMKQRVCWRNPLIVQREIDQTRLVLDDGQDDPDFSFLVVGDSGSGPHRGHNPQRQIAEQMVRHREECRFVLHTGDVMYLVGSREYYPKNFIRPYREFLVNGENVDQIAYDRMVFNRPFLPVPGNHDYYDLPYLYGVLSQLAWPLKRLLGNQLDFDVGWHGSFKGDAYARAFLDYLRLLDPAALETHLDTHYTAQTAEGRCLRYQPGQFTRLPNRYYTFRAGGIDFFALDSNTFNLPIPLPKTAQGQADRHQLEQQRNQLEQQRMQMMQAANQLNPDDPDEAQQLDDLQARLEQIGEAKKDIDKQLNCRDRTIDDEQLDWLKQQLIASWQTDEVRGRVLMFHHPPYVTEATKWNQAQTLAVRYHLRQVLDAVAAEVGAQTQGRSVVDLVLNGHAHCLEHLQTLDTGHADAYTDWIVCGGSGYSLRRQRREGPELLERAAGKERLVAKSCLYVGRNGQGEKRRRPYSCLRIDVMDGTPPRFVVRPLISERFQHTWSDYALDTFKVGAAYRSR